MKKIIVGVMALMLLLMTGCSKTDYDNEDFGNAYSRESVNHISESILFGYGRYEAEGIALKYLYDSKEIYDIHGDTFQITGDEIVCYKYTAQSFFSLSIYEGEADYGFKFEDGTYRIKLSKRYFGKWKVISAGWEHPENDNITEINKLFSYFLRTSLEVRSFLLEDIFIDLLCQR